MVRMNGLKGNSNGSFNLQEEQNRDSHYRDVYRLMMHFQSLDQRQSLEARRNNHKGLHVPMFTKKTTSDKKSVVVDADDDDDDDDITIQTSNVTKKSGRKRIQFYCRAIMIDIPLLILFSCFVTLHCIDSIYHRFFIPMFKLSARTLSDKNLRREFTYYNRHCTMHDITTFRADELILSNSTNAEEGVDSMMTHGATLIPQILDVNTAHKLRKFIISRNLAINKFEKIPVSQGKNRISFGIEATEAPIVSEALRQVSNHLLFRGIIQGLLGIDPALTEITAITAWFGAPDQVWHQDVKEDGSGIKFARTFSHSYSLFIALQDTTEEMGATTLCPGTHYCTNSLIDVCDKYGFPLSGAGPTEVWRAGDGALLNQQVWHKGSKHTDPTALERVIFIVSFIGRPDPTRQLSRGTYFHQKWLSWGHTLQDLSDPERSMVKPFSVLRALSFWKPKSRNWGYDFITSAVLRISNKQLGVEPDDLPTFQKRVIENIFHIPEFLQGTVSPEEDYAWQVYLDETIHKLKGFFKLVNATLLSGYTVVIMILCLKDRSLLPAKNATFRMMFSHLLPVLLAWRMMHAVSSKPWNHEVGKFLRPPFPSYIEFEQDDSISDGPTTLPTYLDFLIGTRFDASYLGAYNRWLDYHPGNVVIRTQVEHCSQMPTALESACIEYIHDNKQGKILQQDWRTGDWRIMSPLDSRRFLQISLKRAQDKSFDHLISDIAMLIAFYRFDATPTVLRKTSIKMLQQLQLKLFPVDDNTLHSPVFHAKPRQNLKLNSFLPKVSHISTAVRVSRLRNSHRIPCRYKVGQFVWVDYQGEGELFKGTITSINELEQTLEVAYLDGDEEVDVSFDLVIPEGPLIENGHVSMKTMRKGEKALITRVRPNGWIDVTFQNGISNQNVRPKNYKRLPEVDLTN
jgi:hypothetical protein